MQKENMVRAWCRQAIGIVPGPGCTAYLMTSQAAEQLQEIALAKRCGFMMEAGKLAHYYKVTTPIIAKLYSCADKPIDQADVEGRANASVEKELAKLPEGCPDDLRRRLADELPQSIGIVQKSYADARRIAEQLKLK